jgi:hypothetical protein
MRALRCDPRALLDALSALWKAILDVAPGGLGSPPLTAPELFAYTGSQRLSASPLSQM